MKLSKLVLCLLLATFLLPPLLSFFVPSVQGFNPKPISEGGDIYLEYGAESGETQPPWDLVQTQSPPGTKIEFESTIVHSGNKSIKFTTCHSDAVAHGYEQPRAQLAYYKEHPSEIYISYWVYLPDNYNIASNAWEMAFDHHARLGSGFTGPWYNLPKCYIRKSESNPPFVLMSYPSAYEWGNEFSSTPLLRNQWIHLQMFFKLGVSDGVYRVWQDGNSVFNYTNVNTATTVGGVATAIYSSQVKLYPGNNAQYDINVKYVDDIVFSKTKVPMTYTIGHISLEFESWEDGFESGDFSGWNGTQVSDPAKAWCSVTSTYSYQGSYSGNFTTDGSNNNWARAMHRIQNVTEVYMRSYVRFEDLPDTDGTKINFFRIGTDEDDWLCGAGINRTGGNYYWVLSVRNQDPQDVNTLATINADQWYNVEIYFNETANGNATLWVNLVDTCNMTGDFSSLQSSVGVIGRVYPYIYIVGSQSSAKTVFHDVVRVDDIRIWGGTPRIFQTSEFTAYVGEGGGSSPLSGVKINGSETDSSGYYEWTNLEYDEVYTFVVEPPTGYYPAWCCNIEGTFNWNGTHFLLSHNVTSEQTGYLQLYFMATSDAYVKQSQTKLMYVGLDAPLPEQTIPESHMVIVANGTGTKTVVVNVASRGAPTQVFGAVIPQTGVSFSFSDPLLTLNITFSSLGLVVVTWEESMEPTGSWHLSWFARSDTHTVNKVLGYKLTEFMSSTSKSVTASSSGNSTAYFGWRVWLVDLKGQKTELTNGTRYAWRLFSGSGLQNIGWTAPATTLQIGMSSIQVKLYIKFGEGSWQEKATFVSSKINGKSIASTEWVFQTYTKRSYSGNVTSAWVYWGDTNYLTAIGNIAFVEPNVYEGMQGKLFQGDFIGAVLYPYLNLVGNLFFGLLMLIVCVPIYNRCKSVTPILVMLIIFGGAAGIFTLLIPAVALDPLWKIIALIGLGGLLYKVFR